MFSLMNNYVLLIIFIALNPACFISWHRGAGLSVLVVTFVLINSPSRHIHLTDLLKPLTRQRSLRPRIEENLSLYALVDQAGTRVTNLYKLL